MVGLSYSSYLNIILEIIIIIIFLLFLLFFCSLDSFPYVIISLEEIIHLMINFFLHDFFTFFFYEKFSTTANRNEEMLGFGVGGNLFSEIFKNLNFNKFKDFSKF